MDICECFRIIGLIMIDGTDLMGESESDFFIFVIKFRS